MRKKQIKMTYFILILIISFFSTTIAYAGLSTELAITGEAKFVAKADIRVTNVEYVGATNGASLQYEPTYDIDSTTMGYILPNDNSTITYKITVTNYGDVDQTIYDIITELTNNPNVSVSITGYNIKDIIEFNSSIELYVTFSTNKGSNEVINEKLHYDFRKVYKVEYDANGGSNPPKRQIKYEREDLKLTEEVPTKKGYKVIGWTEESKGTTVKYKVVQL